MKHDVQLERKPRTTASRFIGMVRREVLDDFLRQRAKKKLGLDGWRFGLGLLFFFFFFYVCLVFWGIVGVFCLSFRAFYCLFVFFLLGFFIFILFFLFFLSFCVMFYISLFVLFGNHDFGCRLFLLPYYHCLKGFVFFVWCGFFVVFSLCCLRLCLLRVDFLLVCELVFFCLATKFFWLCCSWGCLCYFGLFLEVFYCFGILFWWFSLLCLRFVCFCWFAHGFMVVMFVVGRFGRRGIALILFEWFCLLLLACFHWRSSKCFAAVASKERCHLDQRPLHWWLRRQSFFWEDRRLSSVFLEQMVVDLVLHKVIFYFWPY